MIRINLLHERESEKIQRKRDPLNIGLQILGGVLLLLVLHYFMNWRADRTSFRQLTEAKQEWTDLAPKMEAAIQKQGVHKTSIAGAQQLIDIAENRSLWGEILQIIMDAGVPEVQYSTLSAAPQPDRRASLTLTGVATGEAPRQVAEKFRQALIDSYSARYENVVVRFRSLEETGTNATLNGMSHPCVRFDLDISLGQEKAKEPNS